MHVQNTNINAELTACLEPPVLFLTAGEVVASGSVLPERLLLLAAAANTFVFVR